MSPKLLAVAAVLVVTASCRDERKPAIDDAELARDIALAGSMVSQPQFSDTAVTNQPERPKAPETKGPATTKAAPATKTSPSVTRTPTVTRTPPPRVEAPAPVVEEVAPAPAPAPAPAFRGLNAGTTFALTTKSQVCTSNLPGDKITATLTAAVMGEGGAYIPAGTTVVLEVASIGAGDTPENATIGFRVRSVLVNDQSVSMDADVAILSELERRAIADKGGDRRKVVTGAVAGAILGQIMGKDTKSTVVGAAAGAATGAAVAAGSRKYEACLPAGGALRVTTNRSVALSA